MLEVVLLGPPQVRRTSGGALPLPPVVTTLLAYLVVNGGHPCTRDTLATVLCADASDETARRRLSTSLWRLRRLIEGDAVPQGTYITATPREVRLNGDDLWVDVSDFEARVREPLATPAAAMDDGHVKALAEAVALYGGDLLEGCYDEWVLRERDRIAGLHLAALARLVLWYQGRDAEATLQYAGLILDRDPLREDVHRAVIRAYADLGRRNDARRQYDTCVRLLDDELGVGPLPETTALMAAVGAGAAHAAPERPVAAADVVARLREAQRTLATLHMEVQRAIDELSGDGETAVRDR